MGTGTSRIAVALALLLALGASACGTKSNGASSHSAPVATAGRGGGPVDALHRLGSAPVPPGWPLARIADGAAMPYPPGWSRIPGDPGTATAALLDARHLFVGYLNVTPRQGAETLQGWAAFRVRHNVEEGDRRVRTLAARSGVRFRGGHGSCVEDSYTTSIGTRYVELACLLAGRRPSVVVVGAAPPSSWPRVAPLLAAAISASSA
jgi:hypothetical protein